ncbi:uncharacterized protein B0P05DRAFT_61674 [Gilbertella persicaria]|uniref:uncharacterized protein n=1 Tax=Gilbertella persicaria TaxID=101096 RepID=UPI00221E42DC|nr:uncharacterized protein B0P05DRAFT_61674 [Gilbertella persicaria]KAI8082680.1 hypothetical protein B0P05DRAFT_61674 [Gilbertella persicaria]
MPKEQKLNENQLLNNKQQRQQINMPTSSVSQAYPFGISFSSNVQISESDDIAYIEKRTAHNALERQRREGLNSKFQELAHVLPALQQIRRPSKSMIVAKSLEFVSNAQERESEYQEQLRTLRKENEQLMRQASLSRKRNKKQERKSKSPSPKQQEEPASHETPSPKQEYISKKRSREDASPPMDSPQQLLSPPLVQSNVNKKRKKNTTTETQSSSYTLQPLTTEQPSMAQRQFYHQRYDSVQSVSTSSTSSNFISAQIQPEMISPAVSRHNSLTISDPLSLAFNNENNSDMLINPSFNMTSPFGTEHVFYNTFDHIVSSIPALRTPIGSSSSSVIQPQQQPEETNYDPTLDILNSFMQAQDPSSEHQYWH